MYRVKAANGMTSSRLDESALLSMSYQVSRKRVTIGNAKLALRRVIGNLINESADRKRRFASVTTVEHRMLRLERQDDLELYAGN